MGASGRRDQPVPYRALHEVGGRCGPEQLHDVGLVVLRRAHGDLQQLGDFLGGMTFGEQLQHFALPGREEHFAAGVLRLAASIRCTVSARAGAT